MPTRFHKTSTRVVVSRPGFDAANPALPNKNKIFDSDWDFSGVLITCGVLTDPSEPEFNNMRTLSSAPIEIPFDPPGYVPAAYVFCEHTNPSAHAGEEIGDGNVHTFPISGNDWLDNVPCEVKGDRIILRRPKFYLNSSQNGWIWRGAYIRWPGKIRYSVFGVSQ